jgi:hypothetical protein
MERWADRHAKSIQSSEGDMPGRVVAWPIEE